MANHQQLISDSDESSSDEMEVNLRILRARNFRNSDPVLCVPIELPENVKAYLNNWKLERDAEEIEICQDLLERVLGNYVIIKNIMSHLPWQDKLVCKKVAPLWNSALQTLRKEQLDPVDFSALLGQDYKVVGVTLKKSSEFCNVPLVVLLFYNNACDDYSCSECRKISPNPCSPPCKEYHTMLDYIYKKTAAPYSKIFGVKSMSVSYLPLPLSPTYDNAVLKLLKGSHALYSGVCIPAIPGVEFQTINMTGVSDKQNVINKLTTLSKEYTIKGVIVHLTDNYTLYTNQQETVIVSCLHHLGTLQLNSPFALGGCLVEDSINNESDLMKHMNGVNNHKDFVTGNQMTIGVFAVPNEVEPKPSFEMFSCVIDSSEWSKERIILAMREFAHNIPRYEHSVGLKLSCSGRHQKHDLEQSYFRTLFPHTRLIGCFGNGELGVNYPPRRKNKPDPDAKKRPRSSIQYEKVHSYSTVFMYIGWGKVLVPAPPPPAARPSTSY